jgi:hypothetical protein
MRNETEDSNNSNTNDVFVDDLILSLAPQDRKVSDDSRLTKIYMFGDSAELEGLDGIRAVVMPTLHGKSTMTRKIGSVYIRDVDQAQKLIPGHVLAAIKDARHKFDWDRVNELRDPYINEWLRTLPSGCIILNHGIHLPRNVGIVAGITPLDDETIEERVAMRVTSAAFVKVAKHNRDNLKTLIENGLPAFTPEQLLRELMKESERLRGGRTRVAFDVEGHVPVEVDYKLVDDSVGVLADSKYSTPFQRLHAWNKLSPLAKEATTSFEGAVGQLQSDRSEYTRYFLGGKSSNESWLFWGGNKSLCAAPAIAFKDGRADFTLRSTSVLFITNLYYYPPDIVPYTYIKSEYGLVTISDYLEQSKGKHVLLKGAEGTKDMIYVSDVYFKKEMVNEYPLLSLLKSYKLYQIGNRREMKKLFSVYMFVFWR